MYCILKFKIFVLGVYQIVRNQRRWLGLDRVDLSVKITVNILMLQRQRFGSNEPG